MKINDTRELYHYLNSYQGSEVPQSDQNLANWLSMAEDSTERKDRLLTWLNTVGAGHSRDKGLFFSTAEVSAFMARLAAVDGGKSVLDPVCGTGLLMQEAAKAINADKVHGIELNPVIADIARKICPENATIFSGDSLYGDFSVADSYDLIIAEPPFGNRLPESYRLPLVSREIKDLGIALFCKWIQLLSPAGRAIFLLPANCLSNAGKQILQGLESNGYYLRALIHVPSGNLKSTIFESYIVVLDRNARQSIFTAQYGNDDALQDQIIKNYKSHRRGGRQAQGRLINLETFNGFKAMEAAEKLVDYARKSGLNGTKIIDLVESIEVVSSENLSTIDGDNDIYIPLHGRRQVLLSIEDIKQNNRAYIRLALKNHAVDARFMADSMNDEVGRLFLESVSRPSNHMPSIDTEALRGATYYLPARQVQEKVLNVRSKILALRAELDEIDSSLKNQPTQADRLFQCVKRVNHEDSLENWLECLPYPLASILWRYSAFNGISKERNEILLHYFEALAEFWATIYLSAAKSDNAFWADHVDELSEIIKREGLSFDTATFGLWKCVVELFRKKFSALMDADRDRCSKMFATSSNDVLYMLFDARLIGVLQTTNSIRNGKAHGGVLGQSGIQDAHNQLLDQVQICRSIMGGLWERYELVQPSDCRFSGGLFSYNVRIITGTRTPFITANRKIVEGMEDGHLHLLDPEGDRALKLLPFVRVMPSPKTEANACYFYNKRVATNQRFVSYHFEADSQIEDNFEDTKIALESLKPIFQQVANEG